MWAWFPVIWKDQDFDYHYLLEIVKFKIGRMREHIKAHNHHTNVDKDCHRMRIAELVVARIMASNYGTEDYYAIERKWGPVVYDADGHLRHERENELNKDELDYDIRRMALRANEQEEADWAFLCDHLKKYLRRWWD